MSEGGNVQGDAGNSNGSWLLRQHAEADSRDPYGGNTRLHRAAPQSGQGGLRQLVGSQLLTTRGRTDHAVCRRPTWGGEWHPEFGPKPGDIVIKEHWAQSGFANTDLDQQLKQHGIRKVILVGFIANTCVESTGRYAMELAITSPWSRIPRRHSAKTACTPPTWSTRRHMLTRSRRHRSSSRRYRRRADSDRAKCERVLCQNCVACPLKPMGNIAISGDTLTHIVVAGSR